jgi:hypothetical protein
MDCLIHDLSLNGQYVNSVDFLDHLTLLLRLRFEQPSIKHGMRCSRTIGTRPVTATQNLREIVQSWTDKTHRSLALQWIQSQGPFWEDDRESADEDYFECLSQDVTDQGLGEAARRILQGSGITTYSFEKGGFDFSPVIVQHGLPENPLGDFHVENFWTLDKLKIAALRAMPKVENWDQTIEQARIRFPKLLLADYIITPLRRETFTYYLAERIFELLGKLQEFVESRDVNGNYSHKTYELIENHFSGGKAWFTDESVSNKTHFSDALTFDDPSNPSQKLFCPWHGKIKTPQFRIHFPWPLLSHETQLRIVYIGPKLTKI